MPSPETRAPRGRLAACLALLLATACQPPAGPGEIRDRMRALERPDLVFVVVDTLRADWTSPYGFAEHTSPELSRWAERGVVFERARAESSWTKISMASLMTSLWPRSHGIRDAKDGLGEAATTLAEVLKEAGYATYGVQTNGWLHQSFGFHQGFDRYMFPTGAGAGVRVGPSDKPALWTHADRVVEEAVRLIQARDPERPMFLYLHFMDVHEYSVPPEFQRFGTDAEGMYQSAIFWTDDAVRRVREALADAGTLDRTVMLLGSDHGETFGEHGVHGHARNVLTPVVWVPLVMRLPFPTEPVRVAAQVRNVDIAPTLLELAGVPVPTSFEGASLLPLVTGEAAPEDRPSYAALGVPLFRDASVQTAVSTGAWTYARNDPADPDDASAYESRAAAPGAEFLFDRAVDPGENVNLVEREREQAARMRARLDAHAAADAEAGVLEQGVRIDPGIADRLRAMGYLR